MKQEMLWKSMGKVAVVMACGMTLGLAGGKKSYENLQEFCEKYVVEDVKTHRSKHFQDVTIKRVEVSNPTIKIAMDGMQEVTCKVKLVVPSDEKLYRKSYSRMSRPSFGTYGLRKVLDEETLKLLDSKLEALRKDDVNLVNEITGEDRDECLEGSAFVVRTKNDGVWVCCSDGSESPVRYEGLRGVMSGATVKKTKGLYIEGTPEAESAIKAIKDRDDQCEEIFKRINAVSQELDMLEQSRYIHTSNYRTRQEALIKEKGLGEVSANDLWAAYKEKNANLMREAGAEQRKARELGAAARTAENQRGKLEASVKRISSSRKAAQQADQESKISQLQEEIAQADANIAELKKQKIAAEERVAALQKESAELQTSTQAEADRRKQVSSDNAKTIKAMMETERAENVHLKKAQLLEEVETLKKMLGV